MASAGGLVRLRGRWVELDRERLRELLDHWNTGARAADTGGLSFLDGMRLLAGASPEQVADAAAPGDPGWSRVEAGAWLAETLAKLRGGGLAATDPGPEFTGVLRPYQRTGVAWLRFASSLRLGVCLADDMGLGKTIQVLALRPDGERAVARGGDALHRQDPLARGPAAGRAVGRGAGDRVPLPAAARLAPSASPMTSSPKT